MPAKRTVVSYSVVVAIVYALWAIRSGVRVAGDTPTYSLWADTLIAAGFNFSVYLKTTTFVAPPVFYLLWVAVVAALKTMLGSSWMVGVVVLNWLSLTAGVYAIIGAVRPLTQSAASMLLAALLFLTAGDLLIFVPYVVSDLSFWALSSGVLVCGVSLAAADVHDRRSRNRTIMTGTLLIMIAVMFRPVSVPLVAFWILAVATFTFRPLVDRLATPVLVIGLAIALVAIVGHAYLMVHPALWPVGGFPAMLVVIGDDYRSGTLVHQSSVPMLVAPATDVWGFVRVTLQKFIFFMTPWLPHYSTAHTVINLLFFVPGYALSMAAISNLRRLAPPQQRAAVVLALFMLWLAVFHAITLVDSDHRYRLPMLPAIVLLASIGLESVRRPRALAPLR